MGIKERMRDSIVAFGLGVFLGSVQTKDGEVGDVVRTDGLRGEVTIRLNSGEERTLRGRDVASLKNPLQE